MVETCLYPGSDLLVCVGFLFRFCLFIYLFAYLTYSACLFGSFFVCMIVCLLCFIPFLFVLFVCLLFVLFYVMVIFCFCFLISCAYKHICD